MFEKEKSWLRQEIGINDGDIARLKTEVRDTNFKLDSSNKEVEKLKDLISRFRRASPPLELSYVCSVMLSDISWMEEKIRYLRKEKADADKAAEDLSFENRVVEIVKKRILDKPIEYNGGKTTYRYPTAGTTATPDATGCSDSIPQYTDHPGISEMHKDANNYPEGK